MVIQNWRLLIQPHFRFHFWVTLFFLELKIQKWSNGFEIFKFALSSSSLLAIAFTLLYFFLKGLSSWVRKVFKIMIHFFLLRYVLENLGIHLWVKNWQYGLVDYGYHHTPKEKMIVLDTKRHFFWLCQL